MVHNNILYTNRLLSPRQLLITACLLGTFSAHLLTHQKITERLKSIHKDFVEKQYKSFEDNRNNELAILQHRNNYSTFKCMKKSLMAYLSATKNAELYVVAVALPKNKKKDIDIENLLITASKIIKKCKKNDSPATLDRFDCKWECWKNSKESDYTKLLEAYKKATLVYIDGCLPAYNSYDDYVKFYADFTNLEIVTTPITIISLQNNKHKDMKFLNIEEMCRSFYAFYFTTTAIKLVKIRNYTTKQSSEDNVDKKIIFADVIDVDVGCLSKSCKIREIEWIDWENCYKLGNDIRYCETAENKLPKAESKIKKEYPVLEYNKIIRQESLKLIIKNGTSLELIFTSFLIVKQGMSDKKFIDHDTYKYEVLVMVKIKFSPYTFHIHALMYPVKDINGNDPIENLDQFSIHYQEMFKNHTQMCGALDKLRNIILNGFKYEFREYMEIESILKIRIPLLYNFGQWMQSVKFRSHLNTYHAKNNEFIANLQKKFGTNVSFEIFEIDSYVDSRYNAISNKHEPSFLLNYVIISNSIGLDEYKNYTADDFSDVIIYITVKEINGYEASYLFTQDRNYKHASILKKKLNDKNYKTRAENFLKNTIEQLDKDDFKRYKLGPINLDSAAKDLREDCLKAIGLALLEYIKQNYWEFYIFYKNFCQKAIFFAFEKVKMKKTLIARNPVHRDDTYEKLDDVQNGGLAEDAEKESPYIGFIKEEITNIVDFKSFTDVFFNSSNDYMNTDLYSLYMAVLKYLHTRFWAKFIGGYIGDTRISYFDDRSAFLYQSSITENEETYKKVHDAFLDTFKK